MMSNFKKGIIIVLSVVIGIKIIDFSLKFFWIIAELPTRSSWGELILAQNADFGPDKIVLKHYKNEEHVCDYELELVNWLNNQTSQKYKLPKIKDGSVEIWVYTYGVLQTNTVVTRYEDAKKLYRKGLLIYFDSYESYDEIEDCPSSDRYVNFVSGGDRKSLFCGPYDTEWRIVDDAPKLKKYIVPDPIAYFPGDNNCKENKWKQIM
jgi:hypothetical protein